MVLKKGAGNGYCDPPPRPPKFTKDIKNPDVFFYTPLNMIGYLTDNLSKFAIEQAKTTIWRMAQNRSPTESGNGQQGWTPALRWKK